jgi:hypothetical protein
MNGMKLSFGVLALVAIGLVGCGKDEASNAPVVPPVSNNQPVDVENNAPAVSNNSPVATNNDPANNAPVEPSKPPTVANNTPSTDKVPPVTNALPDTKKLPPVNKSDLKPLIDNKGKKELPKIPDPSAAGKDGWTKSQIDVIKLTDSVDSSMKGVKNIRMMLHNDFAYGNAKGFFHQASLIADQNRYLLHYMTYAPGGDAHPETYIVTKKNGKYSTLVGDIYQPGRLEPKKDVLAGWALDSTHYLCASVGTAKKPFTELVSAAKKAKWKISVETKKFGTASYQRVIMEAPTKPARRYEIMIEPTMKLPVSFSAAVFDKKKISSSLNIKWSKSNKPLTDEDLKPTVKTETINTITPAEAAKLGAIPKG